MSFTVQAGSFRRIIASATQQGADPSALWQAAGSSPLVEDAVRLPATQLFKLWALAARQAPQHLTLQVTRNINLEQFGLFGFAILTAPNCSTVLQTVAQLFPIVTDSGKFTSEQRERSLLVRWQRAASPNTGQQLSTEATLAHFVACSRQAFGDCARLKRVSLSHALSAQRRLALSDYLDCSVVGDAGKDELEWDREFCDAIPRLANPAMHAYFVAAAEQLVAAVTAKVSCADTVRAQLRRRLAEGEPALHDVALALGLSPRTLRRRLADEGVTYRKLVDQVRQELAAELLCHSDAPLTRVALDLGFSDSTAFSRAHRRWHGTAPKAVRGAAKRAE